MASQYVVYPPQGVASWKDPVDTQADLPSAGNSLGDARVTQDTSDIYVWTGTAWQKVGGGSGPTAVGDIQIWLYDREGMASTNTSCGYYNTVFKDTGTSGGYWTYVSDAANGDSITIATAGLYAVDVTDAPYVQFTQWGPTLNSTGLSSDVNNLPNGQALALVWGGASAFGYGYQPWSCSSTQYLNVGDVLRWQCVSGGGASPPTAKLSFFKVTYIGDY